MSDMLIEMPASLEERQANQFIAAGL